jgi:hypothetical protein
MAIRKMQDLDLHIDMNNGHGSIRLVLRFLMLVVYPVITKPEIYLHLWRTSFSRGVTVDKQQLMWWLTRP